MNALTQNRTREAEANELRKRYQRDQKRLARARFERDAKDYECSALLRMINETKQEAYERGLSLDKPA